MERLFVTRPNPSKACSSVGIAQPSRNFLAQSFSIGGLYALWLVYYCMTGGEIIFRFRQTDSFGKKSGKTMRDKCGCRASGFSLSMGLERPGRDKNQAQVLHDFVGMAEKGQVQSPSDKEAFGLT